MSIGEFKGIIKRVVLEACDCFCWEDMFKYRCNMYLLYFIIVLLYGCYLGQVSLVKEILNLNETSWLNKGKKKTKKNALHLLCVHTAGGESVKVAGSHSFSMWAGGELRREHRGAFWTVRASRRVEIKSTLW